MSEKIFTCPGCGYVVRLTVIAGQAPPEIPCPDCKNFILSLSALTRREIEILRKLVIGRTVRDLADELYVSVKTIDDHRRHIYRKVGIRLGDLANLTKHALQEGLTTCDVIYHHVEVESESPGEL